MDGLAAYTTSVVEWMDANNIRYKASSLPLALQIHTCSQLAK